jgi:acetyl esterase/lipase
MASALRAQGVAVTAVIEHDLPHVWPMFQRLLPEAGATLRDLAGWIRSL